MARLVDRYLDWYARLVDRGGMDRFLDWYGRAVTRLNRAVLRTAPARVTHDAAGVTYHDTRGRTTTMRWDALDDVRILTTADGPFATDFFWVLLSRSADQLCLVPNDADGVGGPDGFLARLQRLPGFDNEAVLRAAGSTSLAEFPCWARAGPGSPAATPRGPHPRRP